MKLITLSERLKKYLDVNAFVKMYIYYRLLLFLKGLKESDSYAICKVDTII